MAPETTSTTWRKSTRSAQQGACVELAPIASTIALRDSKDPDCPMLTFSPRELRRLAERLRRP